MLFGVRPFSFFFTLGVLLLAYQANKWYYLLGFGTILAFKDKQACQKLGGPNDAFPIVGSEDLAHLGGGIFLISSGDLHHLFNGDAATRGGIFGVDLSSPSHWPVPIENYPQGLPFQPHGIYLSNATQRLFVLTHGIALGTGSGVVVFQIRGSDRETLSLLYLRSIESPLFRNGALNDLVEGRTGQELYVSEWLQFPLPAKGKKHPSNFTEKLNVALQQVVPTFYRGTRVFHCVFSDTDATTPANCQIAASGFYGANGMTKSSDGKTYFLNDVQAKSLIAFFRGPTGLLEEQYRIPVEFALDNLEWADPDTIFAGNIPQIYKMIQKMNGANVNVPGGLVQITFSRKPLTKRSKQVQADPASLFATVDDTVFLHDGTLLSPVSCGYGYGGRVLLGSPFDTGVLVCKTS
eukprot:gb/GEZN01009452.1/.p1 GENE.gb/GEZN01009452.1/~~gb/GEZN01009452.1/.p1  ORF type:complete len:415 (-),score=38.76 gb/GEZN01009452.1/:82-1302(-)